MQETVEFISDIWPIILVVNVVLVYGVYFIVRKYCAGQLMKDPDSPWKQIEW